MHYVARELAERWSGRRILACSLDSAHRTFVLHVAESGPVCIDLRALALYECDTPPGDLLRGWTIDSVTAPLDERRFIVQCTRAGKFRGSERRVGDIMVSVVPTARSVQVREGPHILARLGTGTPPALEPRPVLDATVIRAAARTRDGATLLRGRWMSPEVVRVLFDDPARAEERYATIVALPDAAPVRCGMVIYPLPLCEDGQPVTSLLGEKPRATTERQQAKDRTALARARMQRELARARDAPRLRAIADHLLSLGADAALPRDIALPDGTVAAIADLDSEATSPVALAEELYKMVRRMERALAQLPGKIAAAAPGTTSGTRRKRGRTAPPGPPRAGGALPYRTYRSSGGLDILVGRGAKANDELTWSVARPGEVWLHARDATGAHVILRWSEEGAPPARDLREAAALAAWHSRARGSTVVPVDWTRRRYVRRARGGPAGRAIVERAQTIMARPSASLEKALRLRIED